MDVVPRLRRAARSWQRRSRIGYWRDRRALARSLAERSSAAPPDSRRLRAYAVGLPRSGTTSIHEMFQRSGYRSAHEPLAFDYFPRVYSRGGNGGLQNPEALRRYLQARDDHLGLEMESSYFLFDATPILADMFPDARFILTTRDCYSWLRSVVNRETRYSRPRTYPYWLAWNRRFTGGRTAHALLEDGRLPERPNELLLRSYLEYWTHHHRVVQDAVPESRLLVIPTACLNESAGRLDEFLDLPVPLQRVEAQNATTIARGDFSDVDLDYLTGIAHECCGDVMAEHFPKIRHARDALTSAP